MNNEQLFDTMCDLEGVCACTDKLVYLANDIYNLATPITEPGKERENMVIALHNQSNIAIASSIVLEYLSELKEQCEKVTNVISELWKANNKGEVN